MTHPAPTVCAKTDAVLARHLDGDLGDGFDDGYAFACGETLHAHLVACSICQQALRRARRLDAALAGAAGRAVADHVANAPASWRALEARWLGAVASAAAGEPAAPNEPRVPVLPMQWLVLATAAAAVVAVSAPRGDTPGNEGATASLLAVPLPTVPLQVVTLSMVAPPAVAAAAPNETAREPLAPMPLAAGSVQRWRRQVETAVPDQPVTTIAELAAEAAGSGAPAARLAAAKLLFTAARPGSPGARAAQRAAIDLLAGCGDRDAAAQQLHAALLDLARNSPHVVGQLAEQLAQIDAPASSVGRDELAAVIVGARLQTRELDAAVRRAVRRHPATAATAAAALRCGARADGGALLLLDLWHDLDARGDGSAATAWFAGQPAATFAAVAAELRESRAAPRRQHCLLALAEASDERSLAVLIQNARSSHHGEAHAAAFALANLPRKLLDTVVPAAGDDAAFLLRAALARAGLPAAQPWVDALSLRPAELARVRSCTLAEFPEVASWFRERGASAD